MNLLIWVFVLLTAQAQILSNSANITVVGNGGAMEIADVSATHVIAGFRNPQTLLV